MLPKEGERLRLEIEPRLYAMPFHSPISHGRQLAGATQLSAFSEGRLQDGGFGLASDVVDRSPSQP